MAAPDLTPHRDARAATSSDLVKGIATATGDLIGAHVDALRNQVKDGLADLAVAARGIATLAAVAVAAEMMLGIALALTLTRLGVPAWLACWLVVVALAAVGVALFLRIRRAGRAAVAHVLHPPPIEAPDAYAPVSQ